MFEMMSTDLLSFFFSFLLFFIIYLTVKWFPTDFDFFFFFFNEILSHLYSYKTEALSVLSRPD